jgi:hypothetical protein
MNQSPEQTKIRDQSIRDLATREDPPLTQEQTDKAVELSHTRPELGAKELFAVVKGGDDKPKESKEQIKEVEKQKEIEANIK